MRGKWTIFTSLLTVLFVPWVFSSVLCAEVTIPDPGTFVVDTAGIIDDRIEMELEGWLRELEQKTTSQIKVLTVETTGDEDFFGFVQRHAES